MVFSYVFMSFQVFSSRFDDAWHLVDEAALPGRPDCCWLLRGSAGTPAPCRISTVYYTVITATYQQSRIV